MAWIVANLRSAIGVFAAREIRARQVVWLGTQAYAPRRDPDALPSLSDAAWLLVWNRVGRLAARFNALVARWQAGTLPKPRPYRVRTARPAAQVAIPALPTQNGWINRRIPEAAPSAGALEAMLTHPDTRALVAAAPQAGRLLRPLCRMLGIPRPDWLTPPPQRRAAPPPVPAPPPTAEPIAPAKPPTPDRPLPDYVRAAVRAWKRRGG